MCFTCQEPWDQAIGALLAKPIILRSFQIVTRRTSVVLEMVRVQQIGGDHHHLHREGHPLPHPGESLLPYAGSPNS